MQLFTNEGSNATYFPFVTDKGTKFKYVMAFKIDNFVEVNQKILNEILEEGVLIGERNMKVGDKVTCFGNPEKDIRSYHVKDGHYLEYLGSISGGFDKKDTNKILLFRSKSWDGTPGNSSLYNAFIYLDSDCLLTHGEKTIWDIRNLKKSTYKEEER